MNKTESMVWLRDIRSDYEHPLYKEAVDLAIAALREKADPEWIPNTGTKPECEYCFVMQRNGVVSAGRTGIDYTWELIDTHYSITHYIPIPAPPEFVKKRRYVVRVEGFGDVRVWDMALGCYAAYLIPTESAAQSIADIYERMNEMEGRDG